MRSGSLVLSGAVVGLLLGYLGANVLFVGQWFSLILWGLVALAIGALARERSGALSAAAVYGALLVIAFLISGYRGEAAISSNLGFLALTAVLAVIGAAASAIAAWLAFTVRGTTWR